MKRKLFILLVLIFSSFLFISCDRNNTTTTTTEAETTYTVVFYDYDDSIIEAQVVAEGDAATAPADPAKPADAQYTYTFSGWDINFSNVMSDLHVRPEYTTSLNIYEVNFYNLDGTLLETQNIAYGAGAMSPVNPTMAETAQYVYTFYGWDEDFSNITGNLDVTAVYTTVVKQYTVTFYHEDGVTLLGVSTVDYGSPANPPTDPVKPEDLENTYIFTGWSGDISNVTQDMSVIAEFIPADYEFTVTFYDEDLTTVLGTSVVTYGQAAQAPANPTKPATTQYSYAFSHWSIDFSNVTDHLNVHAVYEAVLNQYTVTFYDEDGTTVLGTSTVDYGTEAEAPEVPLKPDDGVNAYSFGGWSVPIDNVTSNFTTQATYIAVPLGQTYTVNFYNNDGVVYHSEVVNHGDAASGPLSLPVKPGNAQYSYVFSGWTEHFNIVTTNLEVYPTFSFVVNHYTVTFYQHDGITVLSTVTVPYGTPATPPVDPTKPADIDFTYLFIGWDTDFNNVEMDLEIYPIFLAQPIETFDRQLLIDLVNMVFSPVDVEVMITEFMNITELATEEELYVLLQNGLILYDSMGSIDSAQDLQNWYQATKNLGFDRNQVLTILYHVMLMGLENDLEYYAEDIIYYTGEIATYTQELADYQAQIDSLELMVQEYCTLTVDPLLTNDCFNFWEDMKLTLTYQEQYDLMKEALYQQDDFDGYLYHQIESKLNDYLFHERYTSDPILVQNRLDELNLWMGYMNPTQVAQWTPLFDFYEMKTIHNFEVTDMEHYPMLLALDNNNDFIDQKLRGFFYGDPGQPEPVYHGYNGYFNMMNMKSWQIEMYQEYLQRAEEGLDRTQAMVNYLGNPDNKLDVFRAMTSMYDVVDAFIMSIDDFAFDMIMDEFGYMLPFGMGGPGPLAPTSMGVPIPPPPGPGPGIPFGPYFIPLEMITAENIMFIMGKLDGYITPAYSTLNPGDFENFRTVVTGVFDELTDIQDLSVVGKAVVMNKVNYMFDKYTPYFFGVMDEALSFIRSFDMQKSMRVEEMIDVFIEEELMFRSEIDAVILATQGLDVLIGDGSFDMVYLMSMLTNVYYDVTTEMSPNQTELLNTQLAVEQFMTDTLALVDIIKDLDPRFVSEQNVAQILELMVRGERFIDLFREGFEEVHEPLEVYDPYLLEMVIMNFFGEDPATFTPTLMAILETIDSESTYLRIRSLAQYVIAIPGIRSFEDIQVMVGNIEGFGHTQADLVSYIYNALGYVTDMNQTGPQWIHDQINQYTVNRDNAQTTVDNLQANLDQMDLDAQAIIDAIVDPLLHFDGQTYWEVFKVHAINYYHYNNANNNLSFYLDSTLRDDLAMIVQNIYWAEIADPFDPVYYDACIQLYIDFLDTHGVDWFVRNRIETYAETYRVYYQHNIESYDPIHQIILADANYNDLEIFAQNNKTLYAIFYIDHYNYSQNIEYYNEQIERYERELAYYPAMNELFNNPMYTSGIESTMNIIIDDIENMILSMPSDSFELVEKLVYMFGEMSMHGPMPPGMMEFEIPFTAQEAYDLAQDLAMFLEFRFATITPTEMAELELMLLDAITVYVAQLELSPAEETAEIDRLNTLILKYINFADTALDEVVALLNSLTVNNIQMLMDLVYEVANGGNNVYALTIMGAQVINEIYDPNMVDLDIILAMMLEVYFDMEYEVYDPLEVAALATAWQSHLADVNGLIDIVALYDANNLDPATFSTIHELQQKVIYFEYLIHNPEDILNNPPTFSFDYYEMLLDILQDMFWDMPPGEHELMIEDLIMVFELAPGDYESLYYMVFGIGSSVMMSGRIDSPTGVLGVVSAVQNLGYTNAELARYIRNGLMTFLYPALPTIIDTTDLEDEIIFLEDNIMMNDFEIQMIEDDVLVEISLIFHPDPITQTNMQTDAEDIWYQMVYRDEAYAEYDFWRYNYYYDSVIWGDLQDAIEINDSITIQNILDGINERDRGRYEMLVNMYQNYYNYQQSVYNMIMNYEMAYGMVYTSFDPMLLLTDYLESQATNDARYYRMNNYGMNQQIYDLQDEIYRMQNLQWLPDSVYLFLTDPINQDATEDVILILLDELESIANDPNLDSLDYIQMMIMFGDVPDAASLSNELLRLGLLMQNLFSTIDTADETVIEAWLISYTEAYIEITESDPMLQITKQAQLNSIVTTYFTQLLDLPAEVGLFLGSMDTVKTQSLIDQVNIIMMTDSSDPMAEVIRIIAVSEIIDLLVNDGSLNTEIYKPILGLAYEIQLFNGEVMVLSLAMLETSIDAQILLILDQVIITSDLDPYMGDPVIIQQELETLRLLVEDLGALFDVVFNPQIIT